MTALNGEPQVTEEGEIVYVFPDLQVSSSSSSSAAAAAVAPGPSATAVAEAAVLRRAGLAPNAPNRDIQRLLEYNGISCRGALERPDLVRLLSRALPPPTAHEAAAAAQADPTVLQEQELQFSVAPEINKVLAGGLGVVNLGGALYLGTLFRQAALYSVQLPGIYGAVQACYPALLAYAVLFNAIPLVRNLYIQRQNEQIQARNQRRRQWRAALTAAAGDARGRLGRKLLAAQRYGRKLRQIGTRKEDIVYDTRQDVSDLQRERDLDAMRQFDRLLEAEREQDNRNSFQ